MLKNSKGELTTQQIVLLIILIASFVVILFFFFRLNLGEQTQKDICHNSVILKSKSFVGGELDCRTNYLCISSSGNEACGEISPTETIPINSDEKEAKKKEIMKALANEMSDCWWQFGEGELDYSKNWKFLDTAACSVCSIVDFDSDMLEEEITYNEFYDYLQKEKKSSSQTYLNYLYKTSSKEDLGGYLDNEFDLSKEYFVLTALREKEGGTWLREHHPGILLIEILPQALLGEFVINLLTGDNKGEDLESLPIIILEKKKENFDAFNCGEFVTKS